MASIAKQYPGYQKLEDEEEQATDYPFHGGGRKSIRHKFQTPEGHLEVNVYWFQSAGGVEEETVFVNTYHDGEGPNTHFKIEHDQIINGWFGDRGGD